MLSWGHIKKWAILFFILVFPYLIVQVIEKSTHNILTLGYFEKQVLLTDSLGVPYETLDSVQVPNFTLINQYEKSISNVDLLGYNYIVNFFFTLRRIKKVKCSLNKLGLFNFKE